MSRRGRLCAIALALVALGPPARAAGESDRALGIAAGLGLAAPQRQNGQDVSGSGIGGYAEVEYIIRLNDWFTPRAYSGLLLTSPQADCGAGVTPCDVSAKIVFAGGKFRLMAPIPYVGPFLELGLGSSLGRISTRSGRAVDVTYSGLTYHVPVTLGLALGRRHEFELAFQYLFHPDQ
ncbi:MAG TPA: hypothetical protein VFL36_23140 [Myxococcales bacterium]|nr:hypothetical protein [Myxococcales bacterium]